MISHSCHYNDDVISSQNIPQNNLKTTPDRKRFGRKGYSSYIDSNGIAISWIKSIKLTSKAQNKVTHQTMVEMWYIQAAAKLAIISCEFIKI